MNNPIMKNYVMNSLQNLNDVGNDSPEKMEKIARLFLLQKYKEKINIHLKNSYGPDGGCDYIARLDGQSISIAVSIQKKVDEKIKKEMSNAKRNGFEKLIFCTNQIVKETSRTNLNNESKAEGVDLIIFDLNEIAELAVNNQEIQEILDINIEKYKITKEAIRNGHNQLKKEEKNILEYIPRKFKENTNENYSEEIGLEDILVLNNSFIVVESTAGQGKTCAAKSAYIKLLYSDIIPMIPIFIDLPKLVSCEKKIRECIFDLEKNFNAQLNNYILIIDSFDEVHIEEQKKIVDEVDYFLKENQSYLRKAIIFARTNEYDSFLLNNLSPSFYSLCDISDVVMRQYYRNNGIALEDISELSSSIGSAINSFFFANKIILYKNNHDGIVPECVIDILDFCISKEYASKRFNESNLQFLAFYMVENHESILSAKEIRDLGFECSESESLIFSHRIIAEYLAVKYLASKEKNEIVKRLFAYGQIKNKFINTFGLLLNYLQYEGNALFNGLFIYSNQCSENVNAELIIEPDLIDDNTRSLIIDNAIKYYKENNICYSDINTNLLLLIKSANKVDSIIDMMKDANNLYAVFYFILVKKMGVKKLLSCEQIKRVVSFIEECLDNEKCPTSYSDLVYLLSVIDLYYVSETLIDKIVKFTCKKGILNILEPLSLILEKRNIKEDWVDDLLNIFLVCVVKTLVLHQ